MYEPSDVTRWPYQTPLEYLRERLPLRFSNIPATDATEERKEEERMAAEIEKLRVAIEGGEERVKTGKQAATLVGKQKRPEGDGTIEGSPSEGFHEEVKFTPSREGAKTNATTTTAFPSPLILPDATTVGVAVLPPALGTARAIEDLGLTLHPEGITGPGPELNVNPTKGKLM